MKRKSLIALVCAGSLALLAGCSGGGASSKDKTATSAAGGATRVTSGSKTAAPVGSATKGTGTAAPGSSPAATTGSPATDTPDTPVPGAGGAPTASTIDATICAAAPQAETGCSDTSGGPHVVSTVPPVPPGAKQDPTSIAAPDPPGNTLEILVDMDASTPGIQASRDVKVGDVFRVGVVIVNAPANVNNLGGVSSLNFQLNYDRTKIIAPTLEGGASTSRNPALNVPALGGDAAQWTCLPAAQGDLDDPGGIDGDGNPNTGQAFLSCFTPGLGHQGGNIVLATVEFHAVATGSSTLSLSDLAIGDPLSIVFANCPGDPNEPKVPCIDGTVNVK